MTKNAQTRLIERAVRGTARRIALEHFAFIRQPNGEVLWLKGERTVGEALDAWRKRQGAASAQASHFRLVSGMTECGGRSRPVRLWSVAPATAEAGVLCTGDEALRAQEWWNPAMDEPFRPDRRTFMLNLFRERYARIAGILKDHGAELCAREIAAVLNEEEAIRRLDWKEDWTLKAMRRWAQGAARWEAKRSPDGPQRTGEADRGASREADPGIRK